MLFKVDSFDGGNLSSSRINPTDHNTVLTPQMRSVIYLRREAIFQHDNALSHIVCVNVSC